MVLGHSSLCSCCSPHHQRMVWGNYRDLELRQQWQGMVLEKLCPSHSFALGSTYHVHTLLPTHSGSPADSSCPWKGTNGAQRGKQDPSSGSGGLVQHSGEAMVQAWLGLPGSQRGAPNSHHDTIIISRFLMAGSDHTQSVSQCCPSGSTSLPALFFSTQLWRTAWGGTDLHNSSSKVYRYYNQQIMITSILQVGKQ